MSIIRVANVAGVSKSTVSRVLNNLPGVDPEMVRAVHHAVREVGYRPPERRRGPKPLEKRGIKTGIVALVVMGFDPAAIYRMPVFPTLLHGLERALSEHGLSLVLSNFGPDGSPPAVVQGNQADGLLLFGKWDAMPAGVRQRLRQVPAVWVMRSHSDPFADFDHVFFNNATIGPLAARYLLERGHRRLAYFNAMSWHDAFAARERDFTAAVASIDPTVTVQRCLGPAAPEQAMPEPRAYGELIDPMLASPERPTGLFVATDTQLPAVYHALETRGVRPGRDLDVISCDNERQFLAQLSPAPATIDLNLGVVARRSVQQLLWRMRNPKEATRLTILVEPTVVPPGGAGQHPSDRPDPSPAAPAPGPKAG